MWLGRLAAVGIIGFGLTVVACSSDATSDAGPSDAGPMEYYVQGESPSSVARCARGGVSPELCSRFRGEEPASQVEYSCGEEGVLVTTWTGYRPKTDSADEAITQGVNVRGHRGSLLFVDAGDPMLTWQERPNVWVRLGTEDLS